MEIRNCKNCGRLYNYIGGVNLCPACKEEVEAKFAQVKEYIYNNKNALITKISEDNDVSIQQLRQWIREERLVFTDDSLVGIECEICAKTIKTGRFCEACKKNIAHELGSAYAREPEKSEKVIREIKEKAKMRYLDNSSGN